MVLLNRIMVAGILLALLGCIGGAGNPEGLGGARATSDETSGGDLSPKMPDVYSAPVGDPKEDGDKKEDPNDPREDVQTAE